MASEESYVKQEDPSARSAQPLWNPRNTKIMLQLYLARMEKFRDSKWKKKDLWKEICKEMEKAGYPEMTEDILDRKMRNMKKTYKTIKENNIKTGRDRVSWEYFATMQEIFSDDRTGRNFSSFGIQEDSEYLQENPNSEDEYAFQQSTNLDEESVGSFSIPPKEKRACRAMEQQQTDANGELVGFSFAQDDPSAKSAQQHWTPKNTKMMLQLYFERKEKFHDSKWKKKDLWKEICKEMENAGCSEMTDDILDRKMRNLKKTYRSIKENNIKTGRKRVSWEYFTIMEDIFSEDRTINYYSFPTISSFGMQEGSETLHEEPISEDEYASPHSTNLVSVLYDEASVGSCSIPRKEKKAYLAKERYHRKKKIIEMEQQRTDAIGVLNDRLDEANKIQKERNDLLRQFLDKFS